MDEGAEGERERGRPFRSAATVQADERAPEVDFGMPKINLELEEGSNFRALMPSNRLYRVDFSNSRK